MAQVGKSSVREWKEVTIPLPSGNIAAKWWGPYNVQPILAIHGWHDNSGTFDTLIPLLPEHLGFLAVDFPGHGLSDRFPDGTMYGILPYVYVLHQLVTLFKWPKVTLLGHSMGGTIALLYAATYSDRCTAIITLENLTIRSISGKMLVHDFHTFDELLHADRRNQLGEMSKPPSFTYAEMVAKFCIPVPELNISPEFVPYLLERAIRRVPTALGESERYYFTRDSRLKYLHWALFSPEMCLHLAACITCPHLYIRADDGQKINTALQDNEILETFAQNPLFESLTVPGGHYVHLMDASRVSGKISEFIRKYHYKVTENLLMAMHKL